MFHNCFEQTYYKDLNDFKRTHILKLKIIQPQIMASNLDNQPPNVQIFYQGHLDATFCHKVQIRG